MKQTPRSLLVRSACALALGLAVVSLPEVASAQISVNITFAPPPLPVYEQPVLVEEGAIWAPGYWDYGQDGYFWVPGTWVQPPEIGLLWTPGYWSWGDGAYAWNPGYWGAEVGFYGGVNYGFGYPGRGYEGGHWRDRHFYYNTAVSHVNVTNIHNVYTQTVVENTTSNRTSYNGGRGGVTARPSATEQTALHAPHQPATAAQAAHRTAAMSTHALSATVNHGKPELAATAKPVESVGQNAVMGMTADGREERSGQVVATPLAHASVVHARDLPAITHEPAPSTGNVERDRLNQRQQDEQRAGQEKQRQELEQSQARDHEQAARQGAARANAQELERQHETQTQELAQRHAAEQKNLRDAQRVKPDEKRESPIR